MYFFNEKMQNGQFQSTDIKAKPVIHLSKIDILRNSSLKNSGSSEVCLFEGLNARMVPRHPAGKEPSLHQYSHISVSMNPSLVVRGGKGGRKRKKAENIYGSPILQDPSGHW